jgi:hypothetical protein
MISHYGGGSRAGGAKPHDVDYSERLFDRQITLSQVWRPAPEVLASTP